MVQNKFPFQAQKVVTKNPLLVLFVIASTQIPLCIYQILLWSIKEVYFITKNPPSIIMKMNRSLSEILRTVLWHYLLK